MAETRKKNNIIKRNKAERKRQLMLFMRSVWRAGKSAGNSAILHSNPDFLPPSFTEHIKRLSMKAFNHPGHAERLAESRDRPDGPSKMFLLLCFQEKNTSVSLLRFVSLVNVWKSSARNYVQNTAFILRPNWGKSLAGSSLFWTDTSVKLYQK